MKTNQTTDLMVVVCPLWASLAQFCVSFVYYLLELLEKKVFNTGMLQNEVKSHVCLFFFLNQKPQIFSGEEIHHQIQKAHKSSTNRRKTLRLSLFFLLLLYSHIS